MNKKTVLCGNPLCGVRIPEGKGFRVIGIHCYVCCHACVKACLHRLVKGVRYDSSTCGDYDFDMACDNDN